MGVKSNGNGEEPGADGQTTRDPRNVLPASGSVTDESTCWIVVNAAAKGDNEARREFASRYLPVVRAYLGARWRSHPLIDELDDAVQEVFLDMFKSRGALDRVQPGRPGGFRAYLYGVARMVALRCESRRARRREQPATEEIASGRLIADTPELEAVFDRAWSVNLLEQAVRRHRRIATDQGEKGQRQVELLRLRFWEELPIREIARRWSEDAAKLHKEYARARESFKRVLHEVVAAHNPGTVGDAERECQRLFATIP